MPDLELRAAETIDSLRTQLAEARAEATLNRAKYEGALNAIPVVVEKQTRSLRETLRECACLLQHAADGRPALDVPRAYAAIRAALRSLDPSPSTPETKDER